MGNKRSYVAENRSYAGNIALKIANVRLSIGKVERIGGKLQSYFDSNVQDVGYNRRKVGEIKPFMTNLKRYAGSERFCF